jgi:hypothetical protein
LVPPPTPVAQQSEVLTQVTPFRALNVDTPTLGVATIDHVLPFQCSARVCRSKGPNPTSPTAQQSELLRQLVANSALDTVALVSGVGTMDQPTDAALAEGEVAATRATVDTVRLERTATPDTIQFRYR